MSLGHSECDINWLVHQVFGTDNRVHGRELLTLTGFHTENDANAVWEQVAIELDERGPGPGNVRTDVDSIFEELALNAAQHSDSSENCYGIIHVHEVPHIYFSHRSDGKIIYLVGVSDRGIGIPNALRKNQLYAGLTDDEDAILRSTDMDVTGTVSHRDAGLHHVLERTRAYRGELLIISGRGFLRCSDGEAPIAHNLSEDARRYHPGTAVAVALPVPAMEST